MTDEERTAVDTVMAFLNSYAKGDIDGCMATISSSGPVLMFGTNDNEIFKSIEEIRGAFVRDYQSMEDLRWGECRNLHVQAVPGLASVIVEMPIAYRSEGEEVKTLFRYALTLVRESGQWKIRCGMASVPFASGTYTF